MCGIIVCKRFDGIPARGIIEQQYKNQKSRGIKGFGFVSMKDEKVEQFVKSADEANILKALRETTSDHVLFHHRNPTSTPNVWEAAHPILVESDSLKYNYLVMHNGSIKNTLTLKAQHEKEGFVYRTQLNRVSISRAGTIYPEAPMWNDSESLAIELAKDLDDKCAGIDEPEGTIAFVAMQIEKKTLKVRKLFWGRNYQGSLIFQSNDRLMLISSEGKGKQIETETLFWLDYAKNVYDSKRYTVGGISSYPERKWNADKHEYETPPPTLGLLGSPKAEDLTYLDSLFRNEHLPTIGNNRSFDGDVSALVRIQSQLKEVRRKLTEDELDLEERASLDRSRISLDRALEALAAKYPKLGIKAHS